MNEFLSATLWCGITLAAFFCWRRLFLWIKHPLLHPILWSTVIVVLLLVLTSHSFTAYRQESAPLLWLLGPSVVAMAVPIWQRRELILANWRALLLVIVLGIAFSAISMLVLAPFCGWNAAKSLVPKSVTAPVALGVIKEASVGRPPEDQLIESLVAVGVMGSALSRALLGPGVRLFGAGRDQRAVGLALGCASHGVGTARVMRGPCVAGGERM